MKISGLQKLTLLDYPGHLACTIFTSGCNYRCPFCQNASLVVTPQNNTIESEETILDFLSSRKHILEGICITGGEPTLHADLPLFLQKIKEMGYLIKLDTNGTNPGLIKDLLKKQLVDMIAMDIKNSKESYAKTCGIPSISLDTINESVEILKEGTLPYEFRTTIVRELHSKEDVRSIATWLAGPSAYYLQAFVDSGDLIGSGLSSYSKEELSELLDIVKPYLPNASLRGIDT